MTELAGKRVLVTGGAQGIGFEMAMKFAQRGAELVIADINEATLGKAIQTLQSGGTRAAGFRVDVTDHDSIALLKDRVDREAGPVDVLVNNAGVVFGGPFAETPLERHVTTYDVNVLGLVAVTHAFLPDMIKRPEAHLVHIASASGLIGLPYGSTYASSKWAVIGFGESIRSELNLMGHDHVHHTIVCPSYIGTGMFKGAEAPKATQLLEPDHLAEKVIRAVERNKVYVLEPFMVKLTPLLRDILPVKVYDWVSHLFGADTSMAHWTGRAHQASEAESAPQPTAADQPDAKQ